MSAEGQKGILDFVEYWHNRASDTNFIWFPFLFLKLQPAQMLRSGRLAAMAGCFSLYFNVAYLLRKIVFGQQITYDGALSSQVYFLVGFLFWFNLVTKPLWNRRAKRVTFDIAAQFS